MSKGKIIAAVVAFLVVGGIVAAVALGLGNTAPEVEAAEVVQTDLAVTVSASGKIVPGAKADVFAPTAGTIDAVAVVDGQEVKAGQVLAIMDTGPLELSVEQARAGVAGAKSQLSSIDKQAPTSADRAAADAGVDAAWTAYEPAQDAYDAFKKAYDETTSTVIRASMEPTLTALDIAAKQAYAGYASAVAGQAKTGLSFSAERAGANAAIDSAYAGLALAEQMLEKAQIKAPVDGTVLFNAIGVAPGADGQIAKVSAGAPIAPASAIFSIVQLDSVRFAAEVDEVDVDRVKKDMTGRISLDAFPGDELESKVSEISPAAQLTATGGTVFPVYFDVKGVDKDVLIGMKGDVSIEVNAVSGTVSVPIEAILDEDDEEYVFVVENDTLEKRVIVTGVLTDTRAEIIEGLQAGELVALPGSLDLSDGMSVRVKQ